MLIQTSSIYKSSIFFLLKNDKDVAIWARMSLNAILSYGRTRFPWAQLQIPTALPLSAFRPSCHTIFLSTILSHCITSLRILYSLEPQLNWNGEERIKHPYTYQFKKIFLSFLCPLCYDLDRRTASRGPHQAKQFHVRFIEKDKGKVVTEREKVERERERSAGSSCIYGWWHSHR